MKQAPQGIVIGAVFFIVFMILFSTPAGESLFRFGNESSFFGQQASVGQVGSENDFGITIPPVANLAKLFLSTKLGVSEAEIIFLDIAVMEWGDSCLGAPSPEELCAQVITPGYEVLLGVGSTQYSIRTNMDGTEIREGGAEPIEPSL